MTIHEGDRCRYVQPVPSIPNPASTSLSSMSKAVTGVIASSMRHGASRERSRVDAKIVFGCSFVVCLERLKSLSKLKTSPFCPSRLERTPGSDAQLVMRLAGSVRDGSVGQDHGGANEISTH